LFGEAVVFWLIASGEVLAIAPVAQGVYRAQFGGGGVLADNDRAKRSAEKTVVVNIRNVNPRPEKLDIRLVFESDDEMLAVSHNHSNCAFKAKRKWY